MKYRILYKWWTHQVYKEYLDGREFLIGHFATKKEAEKFIEREKDGEE